MVRVDSEHTMAVKMSAVRFSVPVTLHHGEPSGRSGEADFRHG
jgi:hypothetical protein